MDDKHEGDCKKAGETLAGWGIFYRMERNGMRVV